MAFIFHLHEKDPMNFTGPEQKIWRMIQTKDVKWLPLRRSMLLEADADQVSKEDYYEKIEKHCVELGKAAESGVQDRRKILQTVQEFKSSTASRLEAIETELSLLAELHNETPNYGFERRCSMETADQDEDDDQPLAN